MTTHIIGRCDFAPDYESRDRTSGWRPTPGLRVEVVDTSPRQKPLDWPVLTPANDNHVQVGTWPKVVAFTGLAGAGKSTAADILTRRGYSRVKFAGPLKAMMRAIGLTESQIEGADKERPTRLLRGNTPRYAMQRLGCEWGRDLIGEDFWTFLWEDAALKIIDHGGLVVTDDCRFANEVETVRALGGVVFRVAGRGGIAGGHASEAQSFDVDHVIENTGTLDDLESKVITAMEMAG